MFCGKAADRDGVGNVSNSIKAGLPGGCCQGHGGGPGKELPGSIQDSWENGDGVSKPTRVSRSKSGLRGGLLALISGFRVIKGRIAGSQPLCFPGLGQDCPCGSFSKVPRCTGYFEDGL